MPEQCSTGNLDPSRRSGSANAALRLSNLTSASARHCAQHGHRAGHHRLGDHAKARRCRPGRCWRSDSRGSERPQRCAYGTPTSTRPSSRPTPCQRDIHRRAGAGALRRSRRAGVLPWRLAGVRCVRRLRRAAQRRACRAACRSSCDPGVCRRPVRGRAAGAAAGRRPAVPFDGARELFDRARPALRRLRIRTRLDAANACPRNQFAQAAYPRARPAGYRTADSRTDPQQRPAPTNTQTRSSLLEPPMTEREATLPVSPRHRSRPAATSRRPAAATMGK